MIFQRREPHNFWKNGLGGRRRIGLQTWGNQSFCIACCVGVLNAPRAVSNANAGASQASRTPAAKAHRRAVHWLSLTQRSCCFPPTSSLSPKRTHPSALGVGKMELSSPLLACKRSPAKLRAQSDNKCRRTQTQRTKKPTTRRRTRSRNLASSQSPRL